MSPLSSFYLDWFQLDSLMHALWNVTFGHSENAWIMFVGHCHPTVIYLECNLALERIWLKRKCLSATLFAVKFHGKAFTKISSAVHLSSIFLGGSYSLAALLWWYQYHNSLFPSVNAMPSNNGFTPHVLKRRWVFSFLSTFKWKELRNWHFKNWWVRLRMACDEEWSDEWANGERRVQKDWLCDERAQFDCFWVCEWKLRMLQAPPLTWTFFN